MADPPSVAGADHQTDAVVSPATAVTPVGATGAVAAAAGVTGSEGAEGRPVPMALVAVTVNVWATSLVRPVTVHDTSSAVAQVASPGDAVTM